MIVEIKILIYIVDQHETYTIKVTKVEIQTSTVPETSYPSIFV